MLRALKRPGGVSPGRMRLSHTQNNFAFVAQAQGEAYKGSYMQWALKIIENISE
jgi:hypothetical protein